MKLDSPVLGLIAVLFAPATGMAQAGPNLVINGDFENHTGTGCQNNLPNPYFGTVIANATAFGPSNEIDVYTGACYGLPAIQGTTKVSVRTKPSLAADQFTLDLSSPVVASASYSLSFWVQPDVTFTSSVGRVEIGLASTAYTTGTLVYMAPQPPLNQWTQYTLVFTAPVTAGYLSVSSGGTTAGWTHVDAVELRSAGCNPVPVPYCTAKVNSLACVPTIGSTGCASASNAGPFVVSAAQVRNQKSGLRLYGINGRAALPFHNGYLCVNAPVKRSIGVSSGGSPLPANDCTGVFALDMNAFAAGGLGGNPLPALLAQGTIVDCQWWGRDPGFPVPNNMTLSNGLEYVVSN